MLRLFWAPVIFYLNNQGSGRLPASLPCSWRRNRGNVISAGVMGSGARSHCLPLPRSRKPRYAPYHSHKSLGRETPGQIWMLWTRWFLPGAGGKSQLCHRPDVGLWAGDSTSLSPSFFICKMGILTSLCRLGTGEVPGS